MDEYYVYEWIRLDTNEPFYVGKGKGDRWRVLDRDNNGHFNNIVKSIPIAVNIIHNNLDEDTAFGLEVYYIWLYRDIIGYDLCNISDGGTGHGLVGELNGFYGKHHSEETKQKIREKATGRWHSDKSKKKMSENNRGKGNPMYGKRGRNNPNSISVICLTTKRIFYSAREAEKYYRNDASGIAKCCKGKRMSAGKLKNGTPLVWRYLIWNHNKIYRIKNN